MPQELLNFISSASPLGVIALLGVVIYMLVVNQRGQNVIAKNHLSGLPEMEEALERIEKGQNEMRATLASIDKGIAIINTKLNGRDRSH